MARPAQGLSSANCVSLAVKSKDDVLEEIAPIAELTIAETLVESRRANFERMATLGMVSASLAHELSNPLTALGALLELVSAGVAQVSRTAVASLDLTELQSDLREACGVARRVQAVVRDMRAFAQITADRSESVNIVDVLGPCITLAGPQLRLSAHLIEDYGEAPLVLGCASKLGQVFLNLLLNAAQAIPPGNVQGNEIRVTVRADGVKRVSIDIRDSGSGMSAATLARLFEPFFTTKGPENGTGLGLYVVRRLCREMGGEISVRSVLGKGTTFRVLLPAATFAAH